MKNTILWQSEFEQWQNENPEKASMFNDAMSGKLPENLLDELIASAPKEPNATRVTSSKVIQKIAELVPGFIGGSADLAHQQIPL